MTGLLYVFVFIGIGFFIFAGITTLRFKQVRWTDADRSGLRLALEFSLFVIILSLIPMILDVIFAFEDVVWGVASLILAITMLIAIAQIISNTIRYGAHQPSVMISLLVLSGILLTIEFANVLLWESPGLYLGGLLWLLALSGIQSIAFLLYEPIVSQTTVHSVRYRTEHEWMRRRNRADHPYRQTNPSPNSYAASQQHTGTASYRIAYARPPRRTDTHPAVRTESNSKR
ncbi:MAG: hypothetical protein CUN56_12710 [Phototrophicales bacterium]|nr:MAG: hypothetical protein CUN56_12710 [Phototrophicales bacterium]RMG76978.1 MAG: hypothetical protein D6711_02650 [Chloroflexota bacterium]